MLCVAASFDKSKRSSGFFGVFLFVFIILLISLMSQFGVSPYATGVEYMVRLILNLYCFCNINLISFEYLHLDLYLNSPWEFVGICCFGGSRSSNVNAVGDR